MRSIDPAFVHLAWLHAACLSLLGVPQEADSATEVVVFVCRSGGIPEYTDRPCGPSAETIDIDFATPGAGQAVSLAPPVPKASTRPRPVPTPATAMQATARTRCTALRDRLAGIDRQMRDGYPAREAARLWQRWRDARARLRAERC